MKIAICLYGMGYEYSGKTINYEKSYLALNREILSKYDCDIFCHIWTNGEDNPNIEKIKNWYQPKSIVVGNNQEYIDKLIEKGTKTSARIRPTEFSHFYSMSMSNKLRNEYQEKENKKYDLIIVTRYDLNFSINVNLQEFVNKDILYLVDRPKSRKRNLVLNLVYCMDCFFMSAQEELINKMCDIFNKLEAYAKRNVLSIHHAVGIYLRETKMIGKSKILNPSDLYCMIYPDYYSNGKKNIPYMNDSVWLKKNGFVHDRT